MSQLLEDKEREIINLLENGKGSMISICKSVYDILHQNQDTASRLLQYFFEKYETVKSSEEEIINDYMGDDELNSIKEDFGEIVNGFIRKYLLENSTQEIFYEKVWNLIEDDQVFNSEKSKVFALYYFSVDSRIPYYQLKNEDVDINDDELNDLIVKNFGNYQKVRFIIHTPFLKDMVKTCSGLLNMLDSVSDKTDKLVILASIFYCLYNQNQEDKNSED